jgi:uncharacterized protein YndB with AHSA1/START domain
MPVKNKSNEIQIIRIYDAPVKAVWDAWIDPDQVGKWWGPRGFTLTTKSKDVRTGGHWDYIMHGPDGTDYQNFAKYLEVEPYKKMVYDHGGTNDSNALFRVTVLFSESNGKTKLDMTMSLPTPEAAETTRKFIKKAGGESTWDRLSEFLEYEATRKEKFVINRSFKAPIETVFEMWANPEHFSKWIAPTGFDTQYLRTDIKPGGSTFYCMSSGDGKMKMYGKAHYIDIERPHRIVYTQQFCDEHENVSRHPMAPTWPETMLTTVTFAEEGPDQTRVTVEWECYGNVSAEELATFVKARTGMTGGWTGSFDKLEEYLESR